MGPSGDNHITVENEDTYQIISLRRTDQWPIVMCNVRGGLGSQLRGAETSENTGITLLTSVRDTWQIS